MGVEHVPSRKAWYIVLYALSGRSYCQKIKQILGELRVQYYCAYVDWLSNKQTEVSIESVQGWN